MWQQYAPDPKMRMNLGIRRRLAPLLDNDPRKFAWRMHCFTPSPVRPSFIMVMRSAWVTTSIFSTAMVYAPLCSGMLVRMPVFQPPHPISYTHPLSSTGPFDATTVNVEQQLADPASLFSFMQKLNRVRKENPVFVEGSLAWLHLADTSILAFIRTTPEVNMLVLNNLSPDPKLCRDSAQSAIRYPAGCLE